MRISICLEGMGIHPCKQGNSIFASRMSDLIMRAFSYAREGESYWQPCKRVMVRVDRKKPGVM